MPEIFSLTIHAPPERKNPLAPTVKKKEKHSIIRSPAKNSNTNQQLYSYFIYLFIFFSLDLTYWSQQTGNVVQVLDYREQQPNQEVLWLKFADWTKN